MKRFGLLATSLGLSAAFGAAPSNTYVQLISGKIDTLDPRQAYDTTSSELLENMYETLITYKGNDLKGFQPALATALPSISGDKKQYTFNLRKGVRFHSGNSFSCKDVRYTYLSVLISGNSDSWAWFMRDSLLNTVNDPKTDKIPWNKVSNTIVCKSDYQVTFNLAKIDPAFLAKLAFTNGGIIDSQFAIKLGEWSGTEKDWEKWTNVDLHGSKLDKSLGGGTGAYQLVQQTTDQYIFKAFDGYWGKKPAINNVIIKIVPELATRISALKQNEAQRIDLNPRSNLSQVKGDPNITIVDGISNVSTFAMMMNQKITPSSALGSGKLDGNGIPSNFFSDLNVRKAFNYSFSQQQYLKAASEGKGRLDTMALPDTFFGYDPKVPVYDLDPKKATEYFKKAWNGQIWEKGFVLSVEYSANADSTRLLAEMLKQNVEALNPKFKINLVAKSWPELLTAMHDGKVAISAAGWSPDYADPDNFIYTYYHENGNYRSRLNYSNPKMNALIEKARITTDSSQREKLYNQIGRIAYDDSVLILTPLTDRYFVLSSSLKGFKENHNPMLNCLVRWQYLSLSK